MLELPGTRQAARLATLGATARLLEVQRTPGALVTSMIESSLKMAMAVKVTLPSGAQLAGFGVTLMEITVGAGFTVTVTWPTMAPTVAVTLVEPAATQVPTEPSSVTFSGLPLSQMASRVTS